MNKDFAPRFLMGLVLAAVFAGIFVWAGIRGGYFAALSPTGFWLNVVGIAILVVAVAGAVAAFLTWQAERNASIQSDRTMPRQ